MMNFINTPMGMIILALIAMLLWREDILRAVSYIAKVVNLIFEVVKKCGVKTVIKTVLSK